MSHPHPDLELRLQHVEPECVTVQARVPRPPLGQPDFDLESSARRCIGALIQQLLDAGSDPAQVTHTRIRVSNCAYGAVLAAIRDEAFAPARAIHSIFLMNDDAEDAFVTELDALRYDA